MTSTHSQQSDIDWSQVRETVRMINLAVAQIEMSMNEGDDSVDTLTSTFTAMAARVQQIEQQVKTGGETDESAQIIGQCEAVTADVQHAIVAFQFYDKLSQRLSHVSDTLGSLAELVGDNVRIYEPKEWSLLQEKIKSKYTMPAEHHMFDLIMQGMTIEEILKQLPSEMNQNDGIELF